jgi:hypothetical protein
MKSLFKGSQEVWKFVRELLFMISNNDSQLHFDQTPTVLRICLEDILKSISIFSCLINQVIYLCIEEWYSILMIIRWVIHRSAKNKNWLHKKAEITRGTNIKLTEYVTIIWDYKKITTNDIWPFTGTRKILDYFYTYWVIACHILDIHFLSWKIRTKRVSATKTIWARLMKPRAGC